MIQSEIHELQPLALGRKPNIWDYEELCVILSYALKLE